jgi:hypothetical protein
VPLSRDGDAGGDGGGESGSGSLHDIEMMPLAADGFAGVGRGVCGADDGGFGIGCCIFVVDSWVWSGVSLPNCVLEEREVGFIDLWRVLF